MEDLLKDIADFSKKVNTVGTPFPNIEVKIINPDTMEEVGPGEKGETGEKGEPGEPVVVAVARRTSRSHSRT